MKTFDIPSVGEPGTFSLTGNEENYNTERANYEISKSFYSAYLNDFVVCQAEDADMEAIVVWCESLSALVEGYVDDVAAWLESPELGEPALPVTPAIPDNSGFFKDIIMPVLSCYFKSLMEVKAHKVLMPKDESIVGLLQQVKDQEGILQIGDYNVWVKSRAIDANPN